MDDEELEFSIAESSTVSAEELLRGSGRLERLAWLSERIRPGLYFLQDGDRSRQVFQEAAESFVNGQYLAAIALGFSFCERTIAGRLWHNKETKLALCRNRRELFQEARDRGWIDEGDCTTLLNLGQDRDYVMHFRNPRPEESSVRSIAELNSRSNFEGRARKVLDAAIHSMLDKLSV